MSAVSVFGLLAVKHKKMRFTFDNPNNDGSFRILILGSDETAKKMRFTADNPKTETADNVGSFRIWIISCKTQKNAFYI